MRSVMPVLVGAVVAAGCAAVKYEYGSWGGGSGGHTSDGKGGRYSYGVSYLTLDGRVYFVLVADGGGGGRCGGGPPGSGTLVAPDGRQVEWVCDTPNGRTGRVTIGAERFELERGAVFLVNLHDGRTVVEQAAVDMTGLQGGFVEERLRTAASTNDRLAAFLKACETRR